MIAITFNGTLTGYLSIKGAVYCTFPHLQLCAGAIAFSAWLMESNLALLLAIDRCLGMINKNLCEKIFTGKRIYLWIGLSGIYSIVVPISTDTPTFNALYGVWLINPHLGYPETGREYKNIIHHIHNIGIAFSLATFYLIFILSLCKQKFSSQKQFSFSEKPIFLQVFLMSFMNFSCALIYVYEQHFPTPKLIMQFSQFGWMCIHGLPSIIYLVLNKLIRRDVFKMLKISTNGITSVAQQQQQTKNSKVKNSGNQQNRNKYELN
uniref:7TM GPCR serpentine receptor class x (Srx) domain-containing protein n=1 Tax=Panagrolaimus davidi TaxID=227884 RepID=A0A914PJC8_9BILA